MPLMRLDKILSSTGEYSRSEAKSLIKGGAVGVDGRVVNVPEEKFDPERSVIAVNGIKLSYFANHYIMMNKPAGYLSATEDQRAKTVLELMESKYKKLKLFPAGRLDKDTEGLLLLTDDGEFCHNVISPIKKVKKVYFAEIIGQLAQDAVTNFKEGITLSDGYKCRPAELKIIDNNGKNACLITVEEGKFHQVKRMIMACNAKVIYLKRLRIGGLTLDEALKPGEYRELTQEEIFSVLGESNNYN